MAVLNRCKSKGKQMKWQFELMIRAIQGNSCILLSKFLNRMNGLNRPDAIIYLLIAITLLCPNELNMQCFPYFTPFSSDDEFYQSSGTIFQKLKLFTCTENFLKGSISLVVIGARPLLSIVQLLLHRYREDKKIRY